MRTVLEEEQRAKLLLMRYFISSGVHISPHSPPCSRLYSLIPLFLLRAERADCAALTGRLERLCAALFSPPQRDEKSLEKQCLGAEQDPSDVRFISPPHSLFSLFQMTAMISADLLQVWTI